MPARQHTPKLRVETLEDRTTPSVTNLQTTEVFTGVNALSAAANDADTLDGHVLSLTTDGRSTYNAIEIPKSLTLRGPNASVNPVTQAGSRAAEVVIDTSFQPLDIADGKTVTIEGLAFTVPNGKGALTVFSDEYAVTFRRNIVTQQAPTYRSVYVTTGDDTTEDGDPVGVGYTSALITENRITDNVNSGTAAIRISTGSNAVVSGNVITGVRNGVQLFSSAAHGARNPVVTNNYISQTKNEGIDIGDNVLNPLVSFNTLVSTNTTNGAGLGAIRIRAAGSSGSVGPSGNVTIAQNYIFSTNTGISISGGNFPAVASLNIFRNSITGTLNNTKAVNTGAVNDATVDLSGNFFGTSAATGPGSVETRIGGIRAYKVESYLTKGTNAIVGFASVNSGNYGFIPAGTVPMRVPSPSTTSPVSGRIQSGVDLATDGIVVEVANGTFPGAVTITNRTLTLTGSFAGQAAGEVIVSGKLTAEATAGNKFLTLNDLAISGTGAAAPSVTGYAGLTIGTTNTAGAPSYTISGSLFQRSGDQSINALALANVGALTVNSKAAQGVYEVTLPPAGGPTITLNGSGVDTLIVDDTAAVGGNYSKATTPDGQFTSTSTAALFWTGIADGALLFLSSETGP